MKIAVLPYDPSFPNKYIERMVEAIKIAYPDAQITSYPQIKNLLSLRGYDYVWLNWFENLPIKNKLRCFLSKVINLIILKIFGIKIITTFHNRLPHESTNSIFDRFIFWATFRFSYRIIILTSDTKSILTEKYGKSILKKVVLIPHPTYDCKPKEQNTQNDKFSILFFGHLRPYKNIELIYEAAKAHPEIPFTVAGKPLNDEYGRELKLAAAKVPNINLISHFLSSDEIDDLIDENTILLLPYDLKSSLNSGVVIHAICKKINLITPKIGTVNQLQNKNYIYSYTYNSYEEHLGNLNKMIEIARDEYSKDKKMFDFRINKLYNEVLSNQRPEILSSYIKKLFL